MRACRKRTGQRVWLDLRLTAFVATLVVAAFACAGFGSSWALATPANLLFALPNGGQVLAVGPNSALVDVPETSNGDISSLEVIGPGTATVGPVLKHPVEAAISPNGGYVAWSVSTCPDGYGGSGVIGGTESYNGPAEIFVAKADDLSEPVQVRIPGDFNAGGRADVFPMEVSDSGGVAVGVSAESLGPGHSCFYSGSGLPSKAKFAEALLSAAPSATRFSVISGVPLTHSSLYDGFPSGEMDALTGLGFAFCNGRTVFEVNSDSLAVTRTPFRGPCAFVSASGDVFGPRGVESGHWVEPVAASGRYRVARIDASDKDDLEPLTQPGAPEVSPSGNQTILVNRVGENQTSTDLYDVNAQSGRTTTIPVAGPLKHRFIYDGAFISNDSVLVVGYPSLDNSSSPKEARLAVYNLRQRRWGPVLGIRVGDQDTQVCPLPSGSALFLSWNDQDDGKIDLINAAGPSVQPIRTSSLGPIEDQPFYPDQQNQQFCSSTQILLATAARNFYSIALSKVNGTAWTPGSP